MADMVLIHDVREGNYFACGKKLRMITVLDLQVLDNLLYHLKPIPITEDRLRKLHFVFHTVAQTTHLLKNGGGYMFLFKKLPDGDLILYINDQLSVSRIRFVHQLQNLFYDFTGQVLTRMDDKKR